MTKDAKITIEKQVEAMKAVVAAEELRQMASIARGEITKEQSEDNMGPLRQALGTITWIRDNRSAFIGFMKAQDKAGIR